MTPWGRLIKYTTMEIEKKRKWKAEKQKAKEIKGEEKRFYSAYRGSNPRPRIQSCTQAIFRPSGMCFARKKKTSRINKAHPHVTKGTRAPSG